MCIISTYTHCLFLSLERLLQIDTDSDSFSVCSFCYIVNTLQRAKQFEQLITVYHKSSNLEATFSVRTTCTKDPTSNSIAMSLDY